MIKTTQTLTDGRVLHQYWGAASNVYILECPRLNATFLIDCGMPSDVKPLSKILRKMPPLKAVVATHFHVDHVSGWIKLKTVFENSTLWLNNLAAPFVDGRRRIPLPGLMDYFRILKPCMQEYHYFPRLQEIASGALYGTPFKGGFPSERIDYFSDRQEILPGFTTIPTPGHRPDSLSFLDPDSGILISGDFLLVLNGRLTSNSFVESRADQDRSIALIKSIPGIRSIYPGHGVCVPFTKELI